MPIVLGGDHSITWPAATAVADVHGYGNVGVVHFDAHADTADIIDGNLASHGTPIRAHSPPSASTRRSHVSCVSSDQSCSVPPTTSTCRSDE